MPSAMAYDDVHRTFLQLCATHGTVRVEQAEQYLIDIHSRFNSGVSVTNRANVADVVQSINEKVARYGQKIIRTRYDLTDMDYYVYISQDAATVDAALHEYNAAELHIFQQMLSGLCQAVDHKLDPIECLNYVVQSQTAAKPLTRIRIEELLYEWQSVGYFAMLQDMWHVGPRTIAEFDRYLMMNFGTHIANCRLCNALVFYGTRCGKCPDLFHKECIRKYLRRMSNCPGCKELWSTQM